MTLIAPVVLAGGLGRRLWPLSRSTTPKQFAPLESKQSIFQQTLLRVTDQSLFSKPLIATNYAYRALAKEQARAIGIDIDILVEPSRRDSGPAVAAAAIYMLKCGVNAAMALPCDHLVVGDEEFRNDCREALKVVQKGSVVILGVHPTEPKVEYGYIRPGKERVGAVQNVVDVIERLDVAGALRCIQEGCLWNSGNFLFPPELLLHEMARSEPEMVAAVEEAVAKATIAGSTVFLDDAFGKAPAKSIDQTVGEQAARHWVLPARFGWANFETWAGFPRVSKLDGAGNLVEGPVEIDHTRGCYVRSDGPITAVIGLDDAVVITMSDAVLVSHRDHLSRLEGVVPRLSAAGYRAAREPLTVHRPWGFYRDIDQGARFRAKRITVNPGGKLSLQSHKHRAEHWIVVKGTAEVTLDGAVLTLGENESFFIPAGGVHRLINPSTNVLEVIEVQIGEYLEEDDITRYEDIYARI